ncbi:CLUMA_CG012318, isoform A [Clunio marinus]|uniref:CLUMA_CG012318, isoform A n=1 Tax=Clunio marinus TaxID=568069 RepID=A0A1J1IFG4_9DIPT|nr:CLUMA_CG012318, isoform A [Clunio marinus]
MYKQQVLGCCELHMFKGHLFLKLFPLVNEALTTKSRENSELQVQLSEINLRFNAEFQVNNSRIRRIL